MKPICFRAIACMLTLVLSSAFVTVSQTANGSISRASVRRTVIETRTDDSGQFTLTNLPPDTYRVTVTIEDSGSTTERTVSVPKGETVHLEIGFGTGCDNMPKGPAVSKDDQATILRTSLFSAFHELLDPKQLEGGFVLSTQNLNPAWVDGMLDFRIQLMTPAEIQRKADREGDPSLDSVNRKTYG